MTRHLCNLGPRVQLCFATELDDLAASMKLEFTLVKSYGLSYKNSANILKDFDLTFNFMVSTKDEK